MYSSKPEHDDTLNLKSSSSTYQKFPIDQDQWVYSRKS